MNIFFDHGHSVLFSNWIRNYVILTWIINLFKQWNYNFLNCVVKIVESTVYKLS